MHGRPLLIGQRNAPDIAYDVYDVLDFAVLDSCLGLPSDANLFDDEYAFSFCDVFEDAYSGKPVFQIEFPDSIAVDGGKLSQDDYAFYCGTDGNGIAGFSEILKRWQTNTSTIEGWVQYCGAGLEGEIYNTPTLLEY